MNVMREPPSEIDPVLGQGRHGIVVGVELDQTVEELLGDEVMGGPGRIEDAVERKPIALDAEGPVVTGRRAGLLGSRRTPGKAPRPRPTARRTGPEQVRERGARDGGWSSGPSHHNRKKRRFSSFGPQPGFCKDHATRKKPYPMANM
ncbi:MAG: hypothetical protein MZV64_18310 [Ignavibacteriales bacterium]|nr:hypothetical protein [Ignavibacteriales bacterium]